MAESTQGRGSGRTTTNPARFANRGDLGAAAGQGSSACRTLPDKSVVSVPRDAAGESRSRNVHRVATTSGATAGASAQERDVRAAHVAAVMQAYLCGDDASGDDAGGDDAGGDVAGGDSAGDNTSSGIDDDDIDVDLDGASRDNAEATGGSERTALDSRPGGLLGVSDKGKKPSREGSSLPSQLSASRISAATQLQKSINRNRNKLYSAWPASLLQQACALRRITGQSKQKDCDKMADLLNEFDIIQGRPSPYVADLDDKAKGTLDPFSHAKVMREHPEVITVCDQLLPEAVQRENAGVGGAGAKAAAADAARRELAKRKAREENGHLAKPARKTQKNSDVAQETATFALRAVAEGLGLPDGGLRELFQAAAAPARSEAPSSRAIVDGKTARLEYFDTLFAAFKDAVIALKGARKAASAGDETAAVMVGWLDNKVEKIKEEMADWKEKPL